MERQGQNCRANIQNYSHTQDYSQFLNPSVSGFSTRNNSNCEDSKIQELEKVMKNFRAEFDLKMSIIQEILSTRQEKFTIQKELIDREETLYQKLLGNWTGRPEESQTTHGIFCTEDPDVSDESVNEASGFHSPNPTILRRRSKRKRIKQRIQQCDYPDAIDCVPGRDQETSDSPQSKNSVDSDDNYEPSGADFTFGVSGNNDEEVHDGLDEEENTKTEKTHKRPSYVFEKDQEFSSMEEALNAVRSENTWKYMLKREIADGTKRYYICKYDRKCPARINLLYEHSTTGAILLYRTAGSHTHDIKLKHGLPNLIKQKIMALMNINITTPRPILRKLREGGFPEPTLTQLRNFICYERRRRLGIKYTGGNKSTSGSLESTATGSRKRGRPRLHFKLRNSSRISQKTGENDQRNLGEGRVEIPLHENTDTEKQPTVADLHLMKIDPIHNFHN